MFATLLYNLGIASVSIVPVTLFWMIHYAEEYTSYPFPPNIISVAIVGIVSFLVTNFFCLATMSFQKEKKTAIAISYATPTMLVSFLPPIVLALTGRYDFSLWFSLLLVITTAMATVGTITRENFPFWSTTLRFLLAGIATATGMYILLNNFTLPGFLLEVTSFVPSVLLMAGLLMYYARPRMASPPSDEKQ